MTLLNRLRHVHNNDAEKARKALNKFQQQSDLLDVKERNAKTEKRRTEAMSFCAHLSGLCYGFAGCTSYALYTKDGTWCAKDSENGGQFFCCKEAGAFTPGSHYEACTFWFGGLIMTLLMLAWAWECC